MRLSQWEEVRVSQTDSGESIHVLVVGHAAPQRAHLQQVLASQPDIAVTATVATGAQALASCDKTLPDIAIVSVDVAD